MGRRRCRQGPPLGGGRRRDRRDTVVEEDRQRRVGHPDALGEILDLAGEVHWAVDISGTSSALLLALLAAHDQQPVYVPGRTVNRMSGAYRGEAKTEARDAYVIAETARHRSDFAPSTCPRSWPPISHC